jgi:SAM-dependent methyltransferase
MNKKLLELMNEAIFSLRRKTSFVQPITESRIEKLSNLDPHSDLVNLGCGLTYHHAWDNFDLLPADDGIRHLDLLKRFPIADGSYRYCYNSHVLEHMPRAHASMFLGEIYRILRPGGVIRIVVPDLEGIIRRYLSELESALKGNTEAIARHEWMTIELLDQLTRFSSGGIMGRLWRSRPLLARDLIEERVGQEAAKWIDKYDQDFKQGVAPIPDDQIYDMTIPCLEEEVAFRNKGEIHRWMYDRVSLKELLQKAGFRDIRVCGATETLIPDFKNYHLDCDEKGRIRKPDSLFIESVK